MPKTVTALLAGASGLVGRALLTQLLDEDHAAVVAVLRREMPDLPRNRALRTLLVDFALLPPLPAADELYIALGTTIKVAGSRAAFRAVDFDAVVNLARVAQQAGIRRVAVVSALGADERASLFYNRVKGQAEQALRALRFERLVIARPSLLAGERRVLGQPRRLGEQLSLSLLRPLGTLVPASVRPIDAAVVARAMRRALHAGDAPALQILESSTLQQLGAAAPAEP
jgi:uncharacterized protein YbjT (DUF2867 family)